VILLVNLARNTFSLHSKCTCRVGLQLESNPFIQNSRTAAQRCSFTQLIHYFLLYVLAQNLDLSQKGCFIIAAFSVGTTSSHGPCSWWTEQCSHSCQFIQTCKASALFPSFTVFAFDFMTASGTVKGWLSASDALMPMGGHFLSWPEHFYTNWVGPFTFRPHQKL